MNDDTSISPTVVAAAVVVAVVAAAAAGGAVSSGCIREAPMEYSCISYCQNEY